MVQSPAFSSHLLLFAQPIAGDLWLAKEVCVWHASEVIFFRWWPSSLCLAVLLLLLG